MTDPPSGKISIPSSKQNHCLKKFSFRVIFVYRQNAKTFSVMINVKNSASIRTVGSMKDGCEGSAVEHVNTAVSYMAAKAGLQVTFQFSCFTSAYKDRHFYRLQITAGISL